MSGLRVLFDRDIAAARVVAVLTDTSGNVVRELSAPMRRGCESEIRNELRASLLAEGKARRGKG